jgi:hypothetical protein
MNIYHKYIGFTIISLIIGILVWSEFITISIERISSTSMIINSSMRPISGGSSIWIISMGLIPLLFFISQKISKNTSLKGSVTAIAIIVISGVIIWQLRIQYLVFHLGRISNLVNRDGTTTEYEFDQLKFEQYFGIGLIIGTIMSGLVLRKKR